MRLHAAFLDWWIHQLAHAKKNLQLKGLTGNEYRREWNKVHRDRMREADRKYRKANPDSVVRSRKNKMDLINQNPELRKICNLKKRERYVKKYGQPKSQRQNHESWKFATQSGERWGPIEDCLLFSGKPYRELIIILGRSLTAITVRKSKLKRMDSEVSR